MEAGSPTDGEMDKPTKCYPYFGVRSHLHNFYRYESVEADHQRLLRPKKDKRCSPVLWKIILWFGVSFLIFGAVLIVLGHFVPRKPTLLPATKDGRFAVVDEEVARVNQALECLPTVGFVLFAVAAVLILVSIILPTQFNEYCFEDRAVLSDTHPDLNYTSLPAEDTCSSVQSSVPKTEQVLAVQPASKPEQSYDPIE